MQRATRLLFLDAYINHPNFHAGSPALTRLAGCLEAVQRQMDGMQVAAKHLVEITDTQPLSREHGEDLRHQSDAALSRYLTEMHFYLTCWALIMNLMSVVNRISQAGKEAFERHAGTLTRYRNARHEVEHFDERLPGGKHANTTRVSANPSLYLISALNPEQGLFVVGDQQWDVGPGSLTLLQRIVAEWHDAIHTEAVTKLTLREQSS